MLKKFKISKNTLRLSLLMGLMCAIFISFADFNVACDDLRANVLRLHIIANSDSKEDQELKLKIRDRILSESGNIFEGITDIKTAISKAEENLQIYADCANDVIAENGFSYKADAYIGESYFETRVYDDFTLPAGYYKSLIVNVGESKGKNWWCVIFPEVCLPAASDLSATVGEEGREIAYSRDGYIMRFKVVEIYEKIKNLINL